MTEKWQVKERKEPVLILSTIVSQWHNCTPREDTLPLQSDKIMLWKLGSLSHTCWEPASGGLQSNNPWPSNRDACGRFYETNKILYLRMCVGIWVGGWKSDSNLTAMLKFHIEMSFSLHKPITPCTLICLHF